MFSQLLPNAISELFVQATLTRKITLADRYGLMAALCDESLSEDDHLALDRLFYGLRKGYIQVVNELSAAAL